MNRVVAWENENFKWGYSPWFQFAFFSITLGYGSMFESLCGKYVLIMSYLSLLGA